MFVPLLVAAVAVHAGLLHPSQGMAWVGSWAAVVMFGVATVVEIVKQRDVVKPRPKPSTGAATPTRRAGRNADGRQGRTRRG